jgi:Putative polyhydroxyalkanoic acid system protein (PHA_gran_rgn)
MVQNRRMKHAVPHDLGKEQARKVAAAALNSYASRFSQYAPSVAWQSDDKATIGFSVKGVSLKGSVEVQDSAINLELDVPFLMRPFQGKAIAIIEEEIKTWLKKSKAGEG